MNFGQTIAAVVTAPGLSGVGIIRISGDKALEIGEKIFVSNRGKKLADFPRMLCYGHIYDGENLVDEVLCVYMPAPYTYTTEDVVEVHCHGGFVSVEKVLTLVLKNGARHAEPGEFTKLAFLNGRIDLSQAESVMDIINAKTSKSYDVAQKQLKGGLSGKIKDIRDSITADLAEITVALDFPEEDYEEVTAERLKNRMEITVKELSKLIDSFETGRILRDGLKVAIVGRPNVGKSSLLNAVLEENRAIVTDIAGTTRDVIKEQYSLSGIPLVLIDTAGIRETDDIVEQIGVEMSLSHMEEADLVVVMLDSSRPFTDEDREILDKSSHKRRIVLVNKVDLEPCWTVEEAGVEGAVSISASTLEGVEEFKDMIRSMVYNGDIDVNNDEIVSNVRHRDALLRARCACEDVMSALDMGLSLDLIETDYSRVWECLGEITGDTVTENLLDTIFANFCIGK